MLHTSVVSPHAPEIDIPRPADTRNATLARWWRGLKVSRSLRLGPVSLYFRFGKSPRITRGNLQAAAVPAGQAIKPALTPAAAPPAATGLAMLVGVGPGLGQAVARTLAAAGFELLLVSRDAQSQAPFLESLAAENIHARTYGADVTDEAQVKRLFATTGERYGAPSLVVYMVQGSGPGDAIDVPVSAYEASLRQNCLGSFMVCTEAARAMLPRQSGSIILVGSTSSLIGRPGHLNLAVGKFGQRALAQVMARELWPKGIHVAHLVVDADVSEPGNDSPTVPRADPHHIAQSILNLHQQPPTAWTSELDLRPWNEQFWQHC